jgi:hypothetical protein
MRQVRTHCPRCGKSLVRPDMETELRETKEKLKALQRSVATHFIAISESGKRAVQRARKGGGNE